METGESAGARVEAGCAAGSRVEAGESAGARVEAGEAGGARVEAGEAADARMVVGALKTGATTTMGGGGRVAVARARASRSSFFIPERQNPSVSVGCSSARKAAHSTLAPTRIAWADGPMPHTYACLRSRSRLSVPETPMCIWSRCCTPG